MKLHKIELTGYCAKSPEWPALYLGTAGSYGNEQLAVTLGKGWEGLTVTATFQPAGVTVLVSEDGTLAVPWEATETALDTAKGRIVFEGVTDGRVLISTDIPYAVGSHSDTEGSNSQPPTPSQWEQFVDEVKGDADRAEKAADETKTAVQDVKDAGAQAVTDIGAAKDSALDAIAKAGEEAAGSISADVQAAKDAAAAAAQSAKDAAAELPKVQQAGQTALDDIATERESSLTALADEGTKQQSAVAGAGTAALEAIGQTEQAAINQIKQTGETQVGAVQSAGTTQISQINSAGAAQVQAVKDEGATQVQAVKDEGAAQTSALDDAAAAHKTELEGIASHPPQPNTETGKWQVWNAESGTYQDTDALYQGGYYTPSVSDDGTLTWQGSQESMPELPAANIMGPKGDQGDPGLGVPSPTQSDAGKVPTVKADGSAYELSGPYAPLSAAIRPTASGDPVSITDSVEWPLQGLKVYGKSTQDGTPSFESPIPIVSAGDDGSIGLTVSNGASLSQSMTISTPNGLPGIPVDSGGNYTDANGQQWVCDEIDFARGVYVQRFERVTFNGSSDELWVRGINANTQRNFFRLAVEKYALRNNHNDNVLLCQVFKYMQYGYDAPSGNNTVCFQSNNITFICSTSLFNSVDDWRQYLIENAMTLIYAIATPIETPLSEEEIAAYRALHTCDGATVVSTAEDVAGLEVKYVADAQKYIDNRLTAAESHIQEIAAAQLNAQTGG